MAKGHSLDASNDNTLYCDGPVSRKSWRIQACPPIRLNAESYRFGDDMKTGSMLIALLAGLAASGDPHGCRKIVYRAGVQLTGTVSRCATESARLRTQVLRG